MPTKKLKIPELEMLREELAWWRDLAYFSDKTIEKMLREIKTDPEEILPTTRSGQVCVIAHHFRRKP